jgi:hypothetical protein
MTHVPPGGAGVSRRAVLAALGAVGVASALAGVATTSALADRERVAGTLAAGAVELRADYRTRRNDAPVASLPAALPADPDCATPGLLDGDVLPTLRFEDVVPGESGVVTSCAYVCANPAYLWLRACLDEDAETAHGDREAAAGDLTPTAGELGGALRTTLFLDRDGDGVRGADDPVVYEGSLAGLSAFACDGVAVGVPTTAADRTNDGPGDYAGTPVPALDEEACVGLGKVEEPDGAGLFAAFEPGDDAGVGGSVFTGAGYDPAVDRYVFTTDAGGVVLVAASDETFNDDGELVAVTLSLDSPGVGFCRVRTKSGGGRDGEDRSDESFADCPRSVRVRTPSPSPTAPLAESREISNLTLFVCGRTERDPPEPTCHEPGRYCVGVEWHLPREAGVGVSTDAATLSLALAATQCRHDDDPRNPFGVLDAADGGDA